MSMSIAIKNTLFSNMSIQDMIKFFSANFIAEYHNMFNKMMTKDQIKSLEQISFDFNGPTWIIFGEKEEAEWFPSQEFKDKYEKTLETIFDKSEVKFYMDGEAAWE